MVRWKVSKGNVDTLSVKRKKNATQSAKSVVGREDRRDMNR